MNWNKPPLEGFHMEYLPTVKRYNNLFCYLTLLDGVFLTGRGLGLFYTL